MPHLSYMCVFNRGLWTVHVDLQRSEPMDHIMVLTNKKLCRYCWETVPRESMPRIAEMDVEMTT